MSNTIMWEGASRDTIRQCQALLFPEIHTNHLTRDYSSIVAE